MIRVGILFPGQGAQSPGMGAAFYGYSEAFKKTFDRIAEAAEMDLRSVCFDGENIDLTACTQPAIYAVSVSIYAMLRDMGIEIERCAGLSLGEYPALHAAGVFDVQSGAALVKKRGELMSAFDGTGGLAAVVGLTYDQVEALRLEHFDGRNLFISNYNLPTQLVVGGELTLINDFCSVALESGAKIAKPLKTSGPFHTPMLREAGEGLRSFLAGYHLSAPQREVYSNVKGAAYEEGDDIASLLARQVSEPVRWLHCMQAMMDSDVLIEVGPGATLSGMVKRLDRRKGCVSINTIDDITGLMKRLEGKDGNS